MLKKEYNERTKNIKGENLQGDDVRWKGYCNHF